MSFLCNSALFAYTMTMAIIFMGCTAFPVPQEPIPATTPISTTVPTAAPAPTPTPFHSPTLEPDTTPSPTPVPSTTPTPTLPPLVAIEFTPELTAELAEVRYLPEKPDELKKQFDAFMKKHTDFISDNFRRISIYDGKETQDGGEHARLWLPDNQFNEDSMINIQRLEKFIKNCEDGTPDCIIHLSIEGMIIPYLTIFSYSGAGDTYTVTSCYFNKSELTVSNSYTVRKPEDNGKEWIMIYEPNLKIRYPKYGYEPIPPEVPQSIKPEDQALEFVKKLQKENRYLREDSDRIEIKEPQVVNGKLCYVFDLMYKDNPSFSCNTFAVAQDMSSYYEIEQVNGHWMLHAQPKSAP